MASNGWMFLYVGDCIGTQQACCRGADSSRDRCIRTLPTAALRDAIALATLQRQEGAPRTESHAMEPSPACR